MMLLVKYLDLFCQLSTSDTGYFDWSLDHMLALTSDLSVTELDQLTLFPSCKPNYNSTSVHFPPLKVNIINIAQTLTIRSLLSLLNCFDVGDLYFRDGCNLLDMSDYIPEQREVSVFPLPQMRRYSLFTQIFIPL